MSIMPLLKSIRMDKEQKSYDYLNRLRKNHLTESNLFMIKKHFTN